jgi:glycosyltransferase involved in cell wall biosynthesis
MSIVVPCFDEMANLQKGVLEKLKNYLDKKKFSYEVIIVDDGSKDGSREFIKGSTFCLPIWIRPHPLRS